MTTSTSNATEGTTYNGPTEFNEQQPMFTNHEQAIQQYNNELQRYIDQGLLTQKQADGGDFSELDPASQVTLYSLQVNVVVAEYNAALQGYIDQGLLTQEQADGGDFTSLSPRDKAYMDTLLGNIIQIRAKLAVAEGKVVTAQLVDGGKISQGESDQANAIIESMFSEIETSSDPTQQRCISGLLLMFIEILKLAQENEAFLTELKDFLRQDAAKSLVDAAKDEQKAALINFGCSLATTVVSGAFARYASCNMYVKGPLLQTFSQLGGSAGSVGSSSLQVDGAVDTAHNQTASSVLNALGESFMSSILQRVTL